MELIGPDRFHLTFDQQHFEVTTSNGASKFSGRAASRLPKLYLVHAAGDVVYVGITKQPMRARLRFGWNATGQHGYHGYAWRLHLIQAMLDVWYEEEQGEPGLPSELETVEAELVFLIRKETSQWPAFQTEIHFHQSTETHRDLAQRIWEYTRQGPPAGPTSLTVPTKQGKYDNLVVGCLPGKTRRFVD